MRSFKGLYCLEEVCSNTIDCCYSIDKDHLPNSDYKYEVAQSGVRGCPRAFRTRSGFYGFLKAFNLKPIKSSFEIHGQKGKRYMCLSLAGKYKVVSFWHKADIPKGAKSFVGLSNGSYVTCYYADFDGWRVVYEPNPNAKEVYKPNGDDVMLQRIWG